MFMSSLLRGNRASGRFCLPAVATAALSLAGFTCPAFANQYPGQSLGSDTSVLLPDGVVSQGGPHWEADQPHDNGVFVGDEDGMTGVVSTDPVGIGCCGDGHCDGCSRCSASASHGGRWFNRDCEPSGIVQRIMHSSDACWIGRADALILWRNAPPERPLVNNGLVAGNLLNASGLDSTAAAGPRFSLFRVDNCTGHALEATYLRAANFRSLRPLSEVSLPYELAAPGIYGNDGLTFDTGTANLGSRLQSFELNRHHCHGKFLRFLAGFRWIEWQEDFSLQASTLGGINDALQTNCFNDLYGGQIGLDANLLVTSWVRFDSVIKAGAYFNNAVQSSQYTTNDPANPGTASVAVGESPVSGAFAGELGCTAVMPITRNLDFRLGYFGLWLSGIAQPTQQLSGQQLTPGQPIAGTINANGSVVVQGVSLGLEGRW
jgi:hypothetical protein